MFSTWRRPKVIALSNVQLPRLPLAPTQQPATAKSWNRLTILFYSSIISTAAAADATAKQRRRRQWDVVIAETEQSLHVTEDPSSSPKLHVSGDGNHHSKVSYDRALEAHSYEKHGMEHMVDRRIQETAFASRKAFAESSRPLRISAFESQNISSILTSKIYERSRRSSSSIYSTQDRRSNRYDSWTPKKHVQVEFSSAKLAIKLLIEAAKSDSVSDADHAVLLEETLNDVSSRQCRLIGMSAFDLQDLERLQYPQYHSNMASQNTDKKKLNHKISEAIRVYASGRAATYGTTLRRIAYSILQSSSPPNVATYTLLINRFGRLDHRDLVSIVISSMVESRITHNEMSVTAILHHYMTTRNRHRFHDMVLRILGHNGGLMLARPGVHPLEVGSSHFIQSNHKIFQAMTPDRGIAFLIVRGYLRFGRLENALFWLQRIRELGIEPPPRLLANFIRYYAIEKQWDAGWLTWQEIQAQYSRSASYGMKDKADDVIVFYSMLQLCERCDKSQDFRDVFNQGLSRGLSVSQLLHSPKSEVRKFSIKENFQRARKRAIRVLQQRVADLIEDNRTWALHILASKMAISKCSTSALQEMFHRSGCGKNFPDWLNSRPEPPQTPDMQSTKACAHNRPLSNEKSTKPDSLTKGRSKHLPALLFSNLGSEDIGQTTRDMEDISELSPTFQVSVAA